MSAADAPPLVSVILPTYNRASHLQRSIGSVLHQSFRDLELIVVDDASTDDTEPVVRAFRDPRIRYVRRDRNGGVAAARNTGLHRAVGRYLAFQDSDDEWLLEKLQLQIDDLAPLDGSCMSVCGLVRTGRHAGAPGRRWFLSYPRSAGDWRGGLDHRQVLGSAVAYTQTWLVPRGPVVEAGGFDEGLRIWDDWDLLIRLSRELPIRTRRDPLVVSDRVEGSLSEDSSRFVHDLTRMLTKHAEVLARHPRELAGLHYLHAECLCKLADARGARAQLLQALKTQPFHSASWRLLAHTILGQAHLRRRYWRYLPTRSSE